MVLLYPKGQLVSSICIIAFDWLAAFVTPMIDWLETLCPQQIIGYRHFQNYIESCENESQ